MEALTRNLLIEVARTVLRVLGAEAAPAADGRYVQLPIGAGKTPAKAAAIDSGRKLPTGTLIEFLDDLSVRSRASLVRGGIRTVAELLACKERDLLLIPSMSRKCVNEIETYLTGFGLALWHPEGSGESPVKVAAAPVAPPAAVPLTPAEQAAAVEQLKLEPRRGDHVRFWDGNRHVVGAVESLCRGAPRRVWVSVDRGAGKKCKRYRLESERVLVVKRAPAVEGAA